MELTIKQVCQKADAYRAWDKDHSVTVQMYSEKSKMWFKKAGHPSWNSGVRFRLKPKKELRPYNQGELRGLMGKVFVPKTNKREVFTAVGVEYEKILFGQSRVCSARDLFDLYQHEDGSPCGVEEGDDDIQ